MKEQRATEHVVHQEVALLLPWYANGTLGGSERVRVEQHVRNCILCRRELAIENATLGMFRHDNTLDQSVNTGFEHLRSRIATSEAGRPAIRARAARQPGNWLESLSRLCSAPYPRRVLLTVPLALAVVAIGLTRVLPGPQSGREGSGTARTGYETLSNARVAAANPDDVHVIFNSGVSPDVIARLLQSLPAQVVDGPDEAGVYTVRLPDPGRADDRRAAIAALRGQPGVLFVEPAQPLAVPRPAPGHSP